VSDPTELTALLAAAQESRLAGRPADALQRLAGLPLEDGVVLERALALADLGAFEDAFALAADVLSVNPDDLHVLLAFVSIADRDDEDDAALAAAERAVEIAPDWVPALLAFATMASRRWALEPEADRAVAKAASVLSVALHWQASPPPRTTRPHSHRSAARSEAEPGGPR
jgi:tetratricopeptide (TPR) repeat protein